tara:strand:- start:41 stop:541 length:501 start_codon:yes stop_codon:yes gene_type:complete
MTDLNEIVNNLPVHDNGIIINYYHGSTIKNYNIEYITGNTDTSSTIDNENPLNIPLSAHVNATIDTTEFVELNNIVNFTDALSNALDSNNIFRDDEVTIKKIIDKTVCVLYKNLEEKDDKCHICNEAYNDDDICRLNNECKHYFHQSCIDTWYSANKKCPICLREL